MKLLSTPHGGLKTIIEESKELTTTELSTPHGGLKTI